MSVSGGTLATGSARADLVHPASFRDPAGFVFQQDGIFKRAITRQGQRDYDELVDSGLYQDLTERGLLVGHREESFDDDTLNNCYKVLVPDQIRHISYFYEWSFDQLKDAALLTLEIQRTAMRRGMSLKDASAFNVQFRGPKPVFIDTLSFESNVPGPWHAYGQFCTHFLAPLALLAQVSLSMAPFLRPSLDGFPLELASALLPWSSWLRFGLLIHIHLHARSQKKYADVNWGHSRELKAATADSKAGVIDSLQSTVEGLNAPSDRTKWSEYYESKHYSERAHEFKKQYVIRVADQIRPSLVYDLGGNRGRYSDVLTQLGIDCICYDADPLCVNQNYLSSKQTGDTHMLPLLLDLTNPTPALGFDLEERAAFLGRSQPDLILALALIHHLRLAENVPLDKIARFLAKLGPTVLIEFVPMDDPMSSKLMGNRPDMFHDYSWDQFLDIFDRDFQLLQQAQIPNSERRLCLFRRRG